MAGPPPPAYSATWRIEGLIANISRWTIEFHLELAGAIAFDFGSVHALHEDLATWSEPFFSSVLADTVTCDVSRLTVNGPFTSVGDTAFLSSQGHRGSPVPSAIAVPVRQIVLAGGRGQSGRFWLPPPAFSDTEFGWQLTPGAASQYASSLTNFFNGVNAITTTSFPSVRFAVFHRQEHGQYLDVALVRPVDTWVLSRRLGTQDRRMNLAGL